MSWLSDGQDGMLGTGIGNQESGAGSPGFSPDSRILPRARYFFTIVISPEKLASTSTALPSP